MPDTIQAVLIADYENIRCLCPFHADKTRYIISADIGADVYIPTLNRPCTIFAEFQGEALYGVEAKRAGSRVPIGQKTTARRVKMGAVINDAKAKKHADKKIIAKLEEYGDDINYENKNECENLDIYKDFKKALNEMGGIADSGITNLKKGHFQDYL